MIALTTSSFLGFYREAQLRIKARLRYTFPLPLPKSPFNQNKDNNALMAPALSTENIKSNITIASLFNTSQRMVTDYLSEKAAGVAQHGFGNLKMNLESTTEGAVPISSEVCRAVVKAQADECKAEEATPQQEGIQSHSIASSEEDVAPEAPPFTTFHLFKRLPIELRLKIWSVILPRSANVRIEACWSNDPNEEVFFSLIGTPGNHNIRRTRKNGLLRVCSESHEAYCKKFPYALPFASPFNSFDENQSQRLRLGTEDVIHIENIPALQSVAPWWDLCIKQEWVWAVKALRVTVYHVYRMEWQVFFNTFAALERLEVVPKKRVDSETLPWLEKEKGRILMAKPDSVVVQVEGIDYNGDTVKWDTLPN